jgi:hypothetical protein
MSERGLTVRYDVHFKRSRRGRKDLAIGAAPALPQPLGRVPRIARLMALAIRSDELIRRGEVKDYAELARLGHVTRARVTQIMNLLNLAPSIQEELLFLPAVIAGPDLVKEWQVRPIAAQALWPRQLRTWHQLVPSHQKHPACGATSKP